jgi:hypothetical protein
MTLARGFFERPTTVRQLAWNLNGAMFHSLVILDSIARNRLDHLNGGALGALLFGLANGATTE